MLKVRIMVLDELWLLMETSVVNPKKRKTIPRNKKQSWSTTDFNKGIQIREYIAPEKPALKQTFLRPII